MDKRGNCGGENSHSVAAESAAGIELRTGDKHCRSRVYTRSDKRDKPTHPQMARRGNCLLQGKDNHEAWIRNTVSEGLKNNRVPALADLDTGADFQEFFRRDGYQYSYTVVEYVTARYGYGKLMELVRRPEKLEETFQMTEEEFYRSWAAYLEENYGTDADERQE